MSIQPPAVFTFTTQAVRVVMIDDAPWFVATDVSDALGYPSAPQMTRNLDDDEKGMQIVHTLGGDQELSVISESGLYAAILKSRKPEAKKFKKWVTSEVLPAIRKTGRYVAPEAEYTGPVEKYVDLTTHADFRYAAQQMERQSWFGASASHAFWAQMRKVGGCRATNFPESQIPMAFAELKRLEERAAAAFLIKCNFDKSAIK
jgi:prophage antirepressor-like protein